MVVIRVQTVPIATAAAAAYSTVRRRDRRCVVAAAAAAAAAPLLPYVVLLSILPPSFRSWSYALSIDAEREEKEEGS